jgi:hypothetical protein
MVLFQTNDKFWVWKGLAVKREIAKVFFGNVVMIEARLMEKIVYQMGSKVAW